MDIGSQFSFTLDKAIKNADGIAEIDGSKNKLKLQENEILPNVIQPTRESFVKGSFVHKGHGKNILQTTIQSLWSLVVGRANILWL